MDTTASDWERRRGSTGPRSTRRLATYVCGKSFLADDDASGGADGIIDGLGGSVCLALASKSLERLRLRPPEAVSGGPTSHPRARAHRELCGT